MNLADLIKPLAGVLGTAIGGPLGGVAVSFLADKLGVDSKTVKSVTEAIQGNSLTPEQVVAVKAAELQFQEFCKQNEIDMAQLEFMDKDSARKMQTASPSSMPAILTSMVTVGFFSILGWMLYDPTIKQNEAILIMLGQLSGAWMACVTFYVGTTAGSHAKTELLANSAPVK